MNIKRQGQLSDYCLLNSSPESRLSQFERLTLVGGTELERALSWIIRQCSTFAINQSTANIDVEALLKAVKFYSSNSVWASDPSSFFVAPTKIPEAQSKLVHGLNDGVIIDIEFPSTYQVQYPEFSKEAENYAENQNVHARYWQHTNGAPATIIALHGWTMGDQRLNSLAFLPGQFYKMGLDVVMFELPYHGRRKPKALSDEQAQNLFPGGNLALTNEAMGQVIHDLRTLHSVLKMRGVENIGVVGMSLGAYIGALWSSLDPLKFCLPIVPMVSMADLAWKHLTKDPSFKDLKNRGLTKEVLRLGYSIHCPLSHQLKVPKDNVIILCGLADKIVPSAQPRMLWNHWEKPVFQRFRGGHLAQLRSPHALKKVLRFFHSQGWLT